MKKGFKQIILTILFICIVIGSSFIVNIAISAIQQQKRNPTDKTFYREKTNQNINSNYFIKKEPVTSKYSQNTQVAFTGYTRRGLSISNIFARGITGQVLLHVYRERIPVKGATITVKKLGFFGQIYSIESYKTDDNGYYQIHPVKILGKYELKCESDYGTQTDYIFVLRPHSTINFIFRVSR